MLGIIEIARMLTYNVRDIRFIVEICMTIADGKLRGLGV